MSFHMVKSWDDGRDEITHCRKPFNARGRSWDRRIRWLEDGDLVKLKMEDGEDYSEVLSNNSLDPQTIWNRFKAGQSILDCVSILAVTPPKALRSKKARS